MTKAEFKFARKRAQDRSALRAPIADGDGLEVAMRSSANCLYHLETDVLGGNTASATEHLLVSEEAAAQCDLIRDVFGNPFRPSPPIPRAVLAWNDRTIPRIAAEIYEERAFDRLPILANALLDAGCDDEELLGHCRSPGPHVRGCWAVDLILGKA